MKKIAFSAFLFLICFFVTAQKSPIDTLEYSKFSKIQMASWDSIENNWDKKFFASFLKKNKIKISCAKCTGVTVVMVLIIHEDGHCHPKFIKGRKCAYDYSKKQIDEIEKSFMLITFPPDFYNTTIKVFLGRVLKC